MYYDYQLFPLMRDVSPRRNSPEVIFKTTILFSRKEEVFCMRECIPSYSTEMQTKSDAAGGQKDIYEMTSTMGATVPLFIFGPARQRRLFSPAYREANE